jgi:hypothetical protein
MRRTGPRLYWGRTIRPRERDEAMGDRRWYAADALRADLSNRHHHLRTSSEEEAERRMRGRYPGVAVILARPEESWRQDLSRPRPVP